MTLLFLQGCSGNAEHSGAAAAANVVEFHRGEASYIVATAATAVERRYLDAFSKYIAGVTGVATQRVASVGQVPTGKPAIRFQMGYEDLPQAFATQVRDHTDEDYALATITQKGHTILLAAAAQPNGIRRAVQKLMISSQQTASGVSFPIENAFHTPWMEQREFEPVTWSPTRVRGKFTNPAVDPRVDYHHYTDEQLDQYLAAFDWFGYDGIRVEEGAWQYAIFGSIEKEQEFVKRVAAAAAKNSMNRTLHFLYADFNGYGWVDPSVVYEPAPGRTAQNDPRVRATFLKYYDHYTDLAPYFDRVGGHLLDPGHLEKNADMVYYAKLLLEKMRARNPKLATDVVLWVAKPHLVEDFIAAGMGDVEILLSNYPPTWNREEKREQHALAKRAGLKLGYWSWYISDMEQDHRASMYVNASLLKSEFGRILRDVDAVYHPTYWSEMEGYHLLNMFSMYVSAQLQWDPNRDPHEALREIATGIWGPVNGAKMLEVLRLIEDVRTGPDFKSYWTSRNYGPVTGELGTDDPADDLKRAEAALEFLQTAAPDPGFVAKFPLPFAAADFSALIRSHVRQIADYSTFRVGLAEVRKAAAAGASKARLTAMMESIWKPVPEYDTWIGMGSTIELNAQMRLIHKIEQEYGITVKDPAGLVARDADRIAETLGHRQAYSATPLLWKIDPQHPGSSWDDDQLIDRDFLYLWTEREAWRSRLALLLKRGDVEEVHANGETRYRLKDWRKWALKRARGSGAGQ
jgi:hypothetical protein